MTASVAEAVYWLSLALVIYVFAGYPLLVAAVAAAVRERIPHAGPLPTVALVVPAKNEAAVIGSKAANALALDYPADRLRIVIVSDGSTDGTAEIARKAGGDRIEVIDRPVSRGKTAALNDTIPAIEADVIVFSDAASRLDAGALRALVSHFADPEVGAVSGVYVVERADGGRTGVQENAYWRYETFLKSREARLGVVLGAHGSLYAIRRSLYPYPAESTINDDYVIPMRILQRGFRVVYEPRAVAFEDAKHMEGFGRRVRVMAGNLQQLRELVPLLWPPSPRVLFAFVSHKIGRLVVPWALLALAVSNALLIGQPLYLATAGLQAIAYALALAGALGIGRGRAVRLPYYFCLINAAALVATVRLLVRPRGLAWR